jgi:hypothetical protein
MTQILIKAEDQVKIANGDIKCLKKVLEKEKDNAMKNLLNQADAYNFRFYQGVAQAFESMIKILPS